MQITRRQGHPGVCLLHTAGDTATLKDSPRNSQAAAGSQEEEGAAPLSRFSPPEQWRLGPQGSCKAAMGTGVGN